MAKINFGKLKADANLSSRRITDPRDLFSALPDKDKKFDYLRGPQDQVLDAWHTRRAEKDLVIKMNTGGGKTTVGLLVARSLLNEDIGPVAYLVPNKHLAEQVRSEAQSLGIEVTTDPRTQEYSRGRSILVDVFPRLFNGKSIFGIQGAASKPPSVGLGALVIDDAHACLAQAEQTFRVRIHESVNAYDALLDLFEEDLRQQSTNSFLDLKANRRDALMQIPHWAWHDKYSDVMDIIHPASESDDLKFSWPLVVDDLRNSTAVITSDAIEIQPPILPTDRIIGFSDAKRRVYLTATLADDSILVRDFSASEDSISKPIAPTGAGDIGDRLILLPQQLIPRASDADVRGFVTSLASERNVVVIVPSQRRAEWWWDDAALILDKDNIQEGVQQLRDNPRTGLAVLINRYDGVDLPGDACHILVIDGLPEPLSGSERLEQAQLTSSTKLLRQQVQRLEQGMGRATRSNDDYAAVLLLGQQVANRLNSPEAMKFFSPATRAQMEIAEGMADAIDTDEISELREIVHQCLDRDPEWVALNRGVLAELRYSPSEISPDARAERKAFEAVGRGDYNTSQKLIQELSDGESDTSRKAVLLQRLSAYTHPTDPIRAQEIQGSANRSNKALLRPKAGVAYRPIDRSSTDQGEAASRFLAETYKSGNELINGFEALLSDLKWSANYTKFELAINSLARHIGIASQMPDQDTGIGPDGLWMLPDGSFLVIEAKNEVSQDRPIYKTEASQLSQSMDWFRSNYASRRGTPILIHPSRIFEAKASVPTDCRVIDKKNLRKLRTCLNSLATTLAEGNSFGSPRTVTMLLEQQSFQGEKIIDAFTVTGKRQ